MKETQEIKKEWILTEFNPLERESLWLNPFSSEVAQQDITL